MTREEMIKKINLFTKEMKKILVEKAREDTRKIGWDELEQGYLYDNMSQHIEKLLKEEEKEKRKRQLIHIANYAMMLYDNEVNR